MSEALSQNFLLTFPSLLLFSSQCARTHENNTIMKYFAFATLLLVSSATAFAPASSNGRVSNTSLSAKKLAAPEKKSLASRIFDLDLFEPVKEQNNYGARSKKKLATGKITSSSYIPNGLTKAQYEKIRTGEKAKKEANYKAKMAKVSVFLMRTFTK